MSTAPRITEVLHAYTSSPTGIAGVAFRSIQKDGSVLYGGASGVRGLEHKDLPMTEDTIFRIASCTKLLTAVAAVQLVEQGKLALDDLAEKYIPDIGTIQILTGFEGDKPILRQPNNKITIRQLLTHTAGFNLDFLNPLAKKYAILNNSSSILRTKRTLYNPLSSEPGTKWEYSIAFDWVGRIIEAITEQTLGAYMQQHIFDPLGIHSTTFELTDEHDSRHAFLHFRNPEDKLLSESKHTGSKKVEMHYGGGGAHSTVLDYSAILHALLNDGVGTSGNRILSKESVDLLFTSQVDLPLDATLESTMPKVSNTMPLFVGLPKAWTFGGLKVDASLPSGRSAGSIWWSGATNCYWWIDRVKGVAGVILTQLIPFNDDAVRNCWNECEKLVYDGMKKEEKEDGEDHSEKAAEAEKEDEREEEVKNKKQKVVNDG